MILKIPKSLYKVILDLKDSKPSIYNERITFRGPYGEYQIVPVPDEEYCEERVQKILRYKDE